MPTMQQTRRSVKPTRGTCRLTLTINGTPYAVRLQSPDPDSGVTRLVRLVKSDGAAYHVSAHPHGHECTCPDFVFNRDGLDPAGCKHIKALQAVGILEASAVAPSPEPEPEPEPLATRKEFRTARPEPSPAPAVVAAPAPAKVAPLAWASEIVGDLWSVATAEQRDLARWIRADDSGLYFPGFVMAVPGPSLAELRAAIEAAKAEPEPAACCPPDEPRPCDACVTAPPIAPGFARDLLEATAPRPGCSREFFHCHCLACEADRLALEAAPDFPFLARPRMQARRPSTGATGLADADVAAEPGNLIGHDADPA